MRIVSFGDLFADYYFKNHVLEGVCGGKSNANILVNLSRYYDTAFIGCVGNDSIGDMVIDSLKKMGVDTTAIKKEEGKTKKFFIEKGEYTRECPYCNRDLAYQGLKCNMEIVYSKIRKDDILVIDNTNATTLEILQKVSNKAYLYINYLGSLMYNSREEMQEKLGNRFEIIGINERVYKLLKKKFSMDSTDLYQLLQPKILLIMRGKKGVDILIDGEFIKKEMENPIVEIDPSGADDAFFSEFIHFFLDTEEINEKIISYAYMKAEALSRYVLMNLGARSHLLPLYKVKNYKRCICEDILF